MPSFLIRGLARYAAVSVVAGGSDSSTGYTPDYATEYIRRGVNTWNRTMRWLLPFAKATKLRIVIENPKSHQQIVLDHNTKDFTPLTEEWLRDYDKRELRKWIEQDKRRFKEWKKQ